MKKVTASNFEQYGSGTLIKTFVTLDEVDTDETEMTIQAAEFQAKISQTLEARGWIYDESLEDWVYPL